MDYFTRKIPVIPPLFANGKFVPEFCEKANLFNNFFASICIPIKTQVFSYKANVRIASFDITEEDISLMIKNLDPAKAHGCDNISIKMIKISCESLTVPLKITF